MPVFHKTQKCQSFHVNKWNICSLLSSMTHLSIHTYTHSHLLTYISTLINIQHTHTHTLHSRKALTSLGHCRQESRISPQISERNPLLWSACGQINHLGESNYFSGIQVFNLLYLEKWQEEIFSKSSCDPNTFPSSLLQFYFNLFYTKMSIKKCKSPSLS